MGVGLVLDEFALILHLDDVYWTEEGTKSVEIVILTFALVALILGGFLPFGVNEIGPGEATDRFTVVRTVAVNFLFALIALTKGKGRIAVIGVFVPFVALFGAIRLARPNSPWARRFYRTRAKARARARVRAYRHDRRWSALRRKVEHVIGVPPAADPCGPRAARAAATPPPAHTPPAPPAPPRHAPCPPGCS